MQLKTIDIKELFKFNREVIIEILDDNSEEGYFYTNIIDFYDDKLKLKIPVEDDYIVTLYKDTKIKISIIIENTIYFFHASILKTDYNIDKTFIIKVPENIEQKDLRKNKRAELIDFIKITDKEQNDSFYGIIVNISSSGLRFISNKYLFEDSNLLLEFYLNGNILKLNSVLTNIFEKNSGINECGVKFLDISNKYEKIITDYLKDNLCPNRGFRKSFRLKINIEAEARIIFKDKVITEKVILKDISGSGISFKSSYNIENCDKILLSFKFKDSNFSCIPTKLIRKSKEKDSYYYGVLYYNIMQSNRNKIISIIIKTLENTIYDRFFTINFSTKIPCSLNLSKSIEKILGIIDNISLKRFIVFTKEKLDINTTTILSFKVGNSYINHLKGIIISSEIENENFKNVIELQDVLDSEKDLIFSYILKNYS